MATRLSLLLFMMLTLLSACSSHTNSLVDEDVNKIYLGQSERQLYASANTALRQGQYSDAVKRYDALDVIYPFSRYSQSALQRMIYTHFMKGDYASAAATADRFIHLYPRQKQVDYAYYMKGLADFKQQRGVLSSVLNVDPSWRAAGTQQMAYMDFMKLVKFFPNSKYTPDALQRMIYLRNMFAKKELHIAQYYFKRQMYVAALNRANYIVKEYAQSAQVAEALSIVIKANQQLGLAKAADDARRVLAASYPHSKWLLA